MIVNQRRKRQIIKQIRKKLPNIRVPILPQALVVKSVHLRDLSTLVVSSKDRDTIAVAHFERNEKSDGFDTVVAAIDVVSHEEVVGVGAVSSDAEELREIVL